MDINYFLLLRSKYNQILDNIESSINACDSIDDFTTEYVSNKDISLRTIFNTDANRSVLLERKKHINYLKNLCNQYINSLCDHQYVSDNIDINPDKSVTITYCHFCELNEGDYI